ncbi:unnamed protein product [Penicillium palitans]
MARGAGAAGAGRGGRGGRGRGVQEETRTCHYCHQPGHLQAGCPLRQLVEMCIAHAARMYSMTILNWYLADALAFIHRPTTATPPTPPAAPPATNAVVSPSGAANVASAPGANMAAGTATTPVAFVPARTRAFLSGPSRAPSRRNVSSTSSIS